MVAKLDPASWKLVTPWRSASSPASWTCRRSSRSISAGDRVDRDRSSAALDPILRRLAQKTGELARRVAHQLTARRIGARSIEPGERERSGVGERGVARGVREQHGVLGARGGERRVHRVAFDRGPRRRRPLLLMPAATADPLTGGRRTRRRRDRGDDLVPAPRRGEVEHGQRVAEAHEVTMALDEAGNDQPAAELDERASRTRRSARSRRSSRPPRSRRRGSRSLAPRAAPRPW